MAKTSPTQRSLKFLRENGYTAQVVERWNSFAKVRQDLFGFIDIVAINPKMGGVLGVQTTSATNMSSHRKKILENEVAPIWLRGGNRIQLIVWSKKGPRGKRKVWTATVEDIG